MIALEGVGVRYGELWALREVSFALGDGERLSLLGPSGSGKTTLLRAIAGLQPLDQGRILLDGRVVSLPGRAAPPAERGMGVVFQEPALWPHMTVAQNIAFGLQGLAAQAARQRLTQLAEAMHIAALLRRYPHQLSGGEARRVALARALAPRPRHLLMDEPLSNLDDPLREEMIALIERHLADTGAALLYVTHHIEEAARLGERVLRLEAGRLRPGEDAPAANPTGRGESHDATA